MRATLDVNVLVYAADTLSDRHPRARTLLDHLAAGPAITYVFWPVLIGYVRIITHPGIVATPVSPEQALADVDSLVSQPQVVVAGESDDFWTAFQRVGGEVKPRGNLVPDAHLVALMHEHGVSTIWSHDRDFRKFSGITVKDPFDDRYAGGFE